MTRGVSGQNQDGRGGDAPSVFVRQGRQGGVLVQGKPARRRRDAASSPARARCAAFAAALLSLLTVMLPARGQVTATDQYLARMDRDQDGRVSLEEYQAWMSYAFERMDRNRDGTLTADELPGGRGKAISLAEHRQTLAERFRRQDLDRSGFLDARELAAPPQ